MMYQSPKHRTPPQAAPGFAIIIALSLVSFLVLLVVSLITLVQVELKSSASAIAQAQARENTKLGLMVALSELQKTAGPDRRITARGDILDEADTLNDGRRYWTGVWESAPAQMITGSGANQSKPGPGPLQGWLVSMSDASGDPIAPTLTPGGANPLNTAWDKVTLVGDSSAAPDENVDAALVTIPGQEGDISGAFGWWVGDEGIKAKINIQNPFAEASASASDIINSMRVVQRFGIEAMSIDADATIPLGTQDIFENGINKLPSLQSFAHTVTEGDQFVQNRFHDLTAYSNSLLVDVTTGRLRQDLTHAFEHDEVFDQFYPINSRPFNFREDQDFHAFLNTFGNSTYGPNMGILREYHNTYKKVSESAPFYRIAGIDHGTINTSSGYAQDLETQSPGLKPYEKAYHTNNPLSLVDARIQISVSLDFTNGGVPEDEILPNGNTRKYLSPVLKVTPILVLYNPYNIPIHIPETSGNHLYQLQNKINPQIRIQINGNEVEFNLYEIMAPQWRGPAGYPGNYLDWQVASAQFISRIPESTINPGESLIYSLSESGYLYESYSNYGQSFTDEEIVFGNSTSKTIWGERPLKRIRALNVTNDTTIGESYWLPLSASYIPEALVPGADEKDVMSGSQTYSRLFTGPGRTRKAFGFTPEERSALLIRYEVNEDGAIVDYGGDFKIKVGFSHFPGTHEHRAVGAEGETEIAQMFGNSRGVNFSGMERNLNALQWETFSDFESARDQHIATWRQGLRTINDPEEPVRFIDYNSRAIYAQGDWEGDNTLGANTDLSNVLPFSFYGNDYGRVSSSDWEMPGDWDGNKYRAFVGDSIDGTDNTTNMVLFDVPREPLASLGALQHANVGRYSFHPNYIIGQSYLPPLAQRNNVWRSYRFRDYTNSRNQDAPAIDLPFVLNSVLWDRYFFSSIPQDMDASRYQEYLDGIEHLPSSRITFNPHDVDTYESYVQPDMSNFNAFAPYQSDVTFNTVASKLVVNGGFNINSTSVEAWRALLASTQDLELPVYDATNGQLSYKTGTGALYSRFSRTYGDETDVFSGARRLSQEQINELAEAIVAEIKARGPFGSLSSFINRSLYEAKKPEHQLAGVLQSAIDRVPSINRQVEQISDDAPLTSYGRGYAETPHGPQGTGIPGYLLQSDLLQILGPVLTARSDTFIIRAYGDSRNALTGDVEGRIYCEAIVQRKATPLDVNSNLPPALQTAELISPSGDFGRQFEIVAFRWLSPEEI